MTVRAANRRRSTVVSRQRERRSSACSMATARTRPTICRHFLGLFFQPPHRNGWALSPANASAGGIRLPSAVLALCKSAARPHPEGWHARYWLRPQGVPARRLSRLALFRSSPPLFPGTLQPRWLAGRPCRRHARPRLHGNSHYTNIGRALVGIYDLIGVAWLLRRRKRSNWAETFITETSP